MVGPTAQFPSNWGAGLGDICNLVIPWIYEGVVTTTWPELIAKVAPDLHLAFATYGRYRIAMYQ